MTSHVVRLYAATVALVVFFLAWAVVAARPWAAAKPDPRIAALARREHRLQVRSVEVRRQLDRRWAIYRRALAARQRQIAAAKAAAAAAAVAAPPAAAASPAVRVVMLPPLTITRTS